MELRKSQTDDVACKTGRRLPQPHQQVAEGLSRQLQTTMTSGPLIATPAHRAHYLPSRWWPDRPARQSSPSFRLPPMIQLSPVPCWLHFLVVDTKSIPHHLAMPVTGAVMRSLLPAAACRRCRSSVNEEIE